MSTIDFCLSGAQVLTPDGLRKGGLCLADGRIAAQAGGATVDLSGYLVLPGIVDIHGDGFERHIAPRRGALRDLGSGLRAADAELAANGITTAVFAQFFSWEGGMRSPDFAERLVAALDGAGTRADIRLQLRLETHLIEAFERAEALIARAGIGYVVFNDHLPHAALAAGKRPPRLTGQALKSGRSPEAHLAELQRLHALGPQVPVALDALAARLRERGVRLGSHDDADAAARVAWAARGVMLSEFPETRAAALAAHEGGAGVVLGAPNVVRGASHAGKVSAADLVAEGLCSALASDYHYPAPLQAAFRLVDDGICALAEAWALVSSGPAALLGLEDRGALTPGQRADLVVLDAETRRVEATVVAGRPSYLSGEAAARFIAAGR